MAAVADNTAIDTGVAAALNDAAFVVPVLRGVIDRRVDGDRRWCIVPDRHTCIRRLFRRAGWLGIATATDKASSEQ